MDTEHTTAVVSGVTYLIHRNYKESAQMKDIVIEKITKTSPSQIIDSAPKS